MSTLSKYAVRSILERLDAALIETRAADAARGITQGAATWHLMAVRHDLLNAAIADVTVEAEAT